MRYGLLFLIGLIGPLLASEPVQEEPNQIFFHYLPLSGYHSIGFSSLFSVPMAEIGRGNPAALANYSGLRAGLTFTYAAPLELSQGIEFSRWNQNLPGAAGVGYSRNSWTLAVAYHQKYNHSIQYSGYRESGVVHSFSAVVAVPFFNLFREGDYLSVGIGVSGDYLRFRSDYEGMDFRADHWGTSWKAGINYVLKQFAVAFFYDDGTSLEGKIESSEAAAAVISAHLPVYRVELPPQYGIGIRIVQEYRVRYQATVSYLEWEKLPYGLANVFDYSASLQYRLPQSTDLSLGLYHRGLKFLNDPEDRSSTFLVGALRFFWKRICFRLEVADNHLDSPENYQYWQVNVGLEYTIL